MLLHSVIFVTRHIPIMLELLLIERHTDFVTAIAAQSARGLKTLTFTDRFVHATCFCLLEQLFGQLCKFVNTFP